ncbi:MAG: hypothetical protein HQK60_08485 [Deltaproteobacteria bacterium]|nr:hypothetical protein [Deltaproteobacteria bacterium]
MGNNPRNHDRLVLPVGSAAAAVRLSAVGLIIGFLITTVSNHWVWLDMRFNSGVSIPIFVVLFGIIGLSTGLSVRFRAFLILEAILLAVWLIDYGFDLDALLVVPASLVRDGLRLHTLTLPEINLGLGLVVLAGNLAWLPGSSRRTGQKNGCRTPNRNANGMTY